MDSDISLSNTQKLIWIMTISSLSLLCASFLPTQTQAKQPSMPPENTNNKLGASFASIPLPASSKSQVKGNYSGNISPGEISLTNKSLFDIRDMDVQHKETLYQAAKSESFNTQRKLGQLWLAATNKEWLATIDLLAPTKAANSQALSSKPRAQELQLEHSSEKLSQRFQM